MRNEGGLLKQSEDSPSAPDSSVEESMAVKVSNQAKRMFKSLYQYTIISCMSSLNLSNYWQSDEPPVELSIESDAKGVVIEMDSFPPGNQKAGVQDGTPKSKNPIDIEKERRADELMKKKIKFHFQSHLQKWKRQRFPFKVTLHLLLIVLVTTQVSSK